MRDGGIIAILMWMFVALVLCGLPFYLWQQGDVWGQITGILAGVVIYGGGLMVGIGVLAGIFTKGRN